MFDFLKKAAKPKNDETVKPKEARPNHDGVIEFDNTKEAKKQLEPAIPLLDKRSATWVYVRDKINDRIVKLRLENDALSLDDIKTAQLRGRIAELKEILKLEG